MKQHLGKLEAAFLGQQKQIPPQHSAIKLGGKKAYELARKGETVQLSEREIEIHELQLRLLDSERCSYYVKCSKGTYIRALARDMGLFLNNYACLESIRRVQSGQFNVKDAWTLEQLEEQGIEKCLCSCNILVKDLAALDFSESNVLLLQQGNQSPLAKLKPKLNTGIFAMFDNTAKLFGLAQYDVDASKLVIRCIL